MITSGKTILYFSIFLFFAGIALIIAPDFLFNWVDIDFSGKKLSRILGMVVLILSVYYYKAGKQGDMYPFYKWTVFTRLSTIFFISAFALLGWMPLYFIGFILADVVGAIGTYLALKKENRWQ